MTIMAPIVMVLAGAGGCDAPLPSDLNSDCTVNFGDVVATAEQWLA